MRAEEYRSLRQEINMILKRGYDIYFSTFALSIALIGYGINLNPSITGIIILLSPIFILHFGFKSILEQVRTLRRNAAYIRVFHEGQASDIFWEKRLYKLRLKRKEQPKSLMEKITVVDMLKGFPTVIDVISGICLIIAGNPYIRLVLHHFDKSIVNKIVIIAMPIALICLVVYLCIRRHQQCVLFQGGVRLRKHMRTNGSK